MTDFEGKSSWCWFGTWLWCVLKLLTESNAKVVPKCRWAYDSPCETRVAGFADPTHVVYAVYFSCYAGLRLQPWRFG